MNCFFIGGPAHGTYKDVIPDAHPYYMVPDQDLNNLDDIGGLYLTVTVYTKHEVVTREGRCGYIYIQQGTSLEEGIQMVMNDYRNGRLVIDNG